jgi:ribonuclease P/MRP protein subunit POP5
MVRLKNRYLLFEVHLDNPLQTKDINSHHLNTEFRYAVSTLFGDQGLGLVQASINGNVCAFESLFCSWDRTNQSGHISVKYYSCATNLGILRVNREHFRSVWAALTLMTKIKESPCSIAVVHVSGKDGIESWHLFSELTVFCCKRDHQASATLGHSTLEEDGCRNDTRDTEGHHAGYSLNWACMFMGEEN